MNKTVFALGASAAALAGGAATAAKQPNIILIMVDDMGYSDVGCYGGEIPTPNIDRLAKSGVRYTQFYSTARSCPTRASLMTGLYAHQAGIGGIMVKSGHIIGLGIKKSNFHHIVLLLHLFCILLSIRL